MCTPECIYGSFRGIIYFGNRKAIPLPFRQTLFSLKQIFIMKRLLLFFAFTPLLFQVAAQVNYNANQVVVPYNGSFRPGINMGYYRARFAGAGRIIEG